MELLELHSPHWEALTDKTLQAFRLVAKLNLIQRFYLAGGTGLALHLGHRFSVDLDFFSQEPDSVGPEERAQLHEALDDPNLTITYDKDTTFVATWQNVGISFFRLQQYPLVRPVFRLENVLVASIEEIGAMKLAAIIDRGTRNLNEER